MSFISHGLGDGADYRGYFPTRRRLERGFRLLRGEFLDKPSREHRISGSATAKCRHRGGEGERFIALTTFRIKASYTSLVGKSRLPRITSAWAGTPFRLRWPCLATLFSCEAPG